MSNGKKSGRSHTPSKPKPPKGHEVWFEEIRAMRQLVSKANARGQTDTYWHDRLQALEEAFEQYGLEA